MNKVKLLVIRVVILTICLIYGGVINAYDVEINGIYYNLNTISKTAEVTYKSNNDYNYNNYSGNIIIPETISHNNTTYCVNSIGEHAFEKCDGLSSVSIPNTITTIGRVAFWGCSLASITIPNSVSSIGNGAFQDCGNLSSVILSNTIKTTGNYTFYNCRNLRSIIIPNSITTVGEGAFLNCSSMTSVIIPNSITTIGGSAFSGCSSLTSMIIPEGVTSIGDAAFSMCVNLTELKIPQSVIYIGSMAFDNCKISSIELPSSLTSIESAVFQGCTSLKSIIIPNSVFSIKMYAFLGCKNLTSIKLSSNLTSIGYGAFMECSNMESIEIPDKVNSIDQYAFRDCSSLKLVKSLIEDPFTIDDYVFYRISSSAKLEVPKGTKSKYQALSGWTNYFKEIVEFGNTQAYTLSIKASGNGSASYDGTTIRGNTSSFTVVEGTAATITFTPDNGYRIKTVKVNNSAVSVSNKQYTVSNITKNTSVEVEFEAIPPTTYTLSIKATGNGSASYDGTTIRSKTSTFTVNEGTNATITFTPDNGYRIKTVRVNNSAVSVINKYTVNNFDMDTYIEVEFEAITHTLTIKATENGSASYNGSTVRSKTSSFTVNEGTSATIIFTPDDGYRIKAVMVNSSAVSVNNNQYTVSSISKDTSVEVEFEAIPPTTFTLSIKATGNGSASYDGTTIRGKTSTFTVNEGTNATITFTPDNGYRIKTVKVNSSAVSVSNNQYTVSNITKDTSVEVEFEAITYTLSIKAIGNGSASYNGTTIREETKSFTLVENSSATITFYPDNGYKIKSVKRMNTDVTSSVSNNQYTISRITIDTTIEVEFEAIPPTTYTLSIKAIGNGSASYDGTTIRSKTSTFTVNEGTNATITFSPDNGYRIKTVRVNNSAVSVSNNQYTVSSISKDTSVEVEFEAIPPTTYTLSIKAIGNGSASYDGTTIRSKTSTFTVNEGTNATIAFSPDNGYRIKVVKVNSSAVFVSNNQYTVSNISKDISVEVEFEAIPPTTYTLSIKATGNGSASYDGTTIRSNTSSFTVVEGSSATITFTPDNGYHIKTVKVNSTAVSVSNNQYTISNISKDTSVEVEFEAIPPTTYTLTIKATGNGSASYDGTTIRSKTSTFTVNEGTNATITFTPDNGYRIKAVKVNNSAVSVSNNQYTVSNISKDTTVEVEFEAIPPTTYTLSIKAIGNGSASYDGTTIRSKTSTFTVNEGTNATIAFSPDNGYRIKVVKVNSSAVSVSNNQYTVSSISKDTSVEVEFEENVQEHNTEIDQCFEIMRGTYNGKVLFAAKNPNNPLDQIDTLDISWTVVDSTLVINQLPPVIIKDNINDKKIQEAFAAAQPSQLKAFIEINQTTNPIGFLLRPQAVDFNLFYDNATHKASLIFWYKNYSYGYYNTTSNLFEMQLAAGALYIDDNHNYNYIASGGETTANCNFIFTTADLQKENQTTSYTLSIKASGNGSASYNGTTVRDKTSTFNVVEGTNATITFTPDNGYHIKTVKVNNSSVSVSNNQYTVSNISKDTTVEVEFEENVKAFTSNSISYSVVSYENKTVNVASADYDAVLEVPEKVTYQDVEWKVIGIEKGALGNSSDLTAVVWNPQAEFTESVSNPNLLLYVQATNYAPASIKNVVVNGVAEKITLMDASQGNNFYCPQEFTAREISYSHHYLMTTGIGESRGWETIALPFDVQKMIHSNKGEITPIINWKSGDEKKPFWLMEFGSSGWKKVNSIKANTPYIISMPNNPYYGEEFHLNGSVTFSAENVTVKRSDEVQSAAYNGMTFVPNFTRQTNTEYYALNVNNDYVTYNGGATEGSRFVINLRELYPFEAYMTATASARQYFEISEGMTTGILEIEYSELIIDKYYDLQGRRVEHPVKGLYIKNGKKLINKKR